MKKRVSFILTILFFTFMILCTILARSIHNYNLPKVSIQKVSKKSFPITFVLDDGVVITTDERIIAIPLVFVQNGCVFLIRQREHYNETETYAELVPIELGRVEGEYVEVKNGLTSNDKLIIKSDREITSGQTVLVITN